MQCVSKGQRLFKRKVNHCCVCEERDREEDSSVSVREIDNCGVIEY